MAKILQAKMRVQARAGKGDAVAYARVISDPQRYGFAVGRVRVLETRLLPRSTYERLLDAKNLADHRRILSETVYGGYLETAETADDVERALDEALADLYEDFLEHANLPDPLVDFFRVQHDFENLRGRLKAEALGISPTEMLTDLGSVPAEAFTGPVEKLPERLVKAESRIRQELSDEDGNLPADEIEDAIDTELFTALEGVAKESGSAFVQDLAVLEADIGNLRAFVRARAKSVPVAEVERRFVPGGSIPSKLLVSLYRLPPAEAAARLVSRQLVRGVDPEALADPQHFDVEAVRLVSRRVKSSRMVAMGPEPVLGYVRIRQAEVTALRTVLIGGLAGVPAEKLRGHLKDVV